MAAALGIGRFAYTPLLPDMTRLYQWQFAEAGDVASANYLGYLLGALLAPMVANARWMRLWLGVSLMLSAATTALGAAADDYVMWLILRGIAGFASAYCLILITTQLGHALASDQQASRWGNVHFAGVGLGILICMISLSFDAIVEQHWARLGAVSALLMVLAWWLVAPLAWQTDQPAQPPPSSNYRLDWRRIWPLVLGYGLFGYGYVVAATFVVAMAERVATPAWPAGTVWWVVGASLLPSVYVWQWLANRWHLHLTLRIAYLVEAVGMLLAAYAESMVGLVISCTLLGGTFAAITALGLSAARQLLPQQAAAVIAWMTLAFALGQWIGPAIAGRLADAYQDFVVPCLSAVLALIVAAVLVRPPNHGSA